MDSELISVVIPIYRVEKFLARCVESVLKQTYTNLEVILVDDGSPDHCGDICDQFANRDARIKVVHKENGGLSDARNRGVEQATGAYITFIDSDDYISLDCIAYLYGLVKKYEADVSCCDMVLTESDTAEYCTRHDLPAERVLTGKEACRGLLGNLYLPLVTAWGKLYRIEIARKYPFPVGRKHEDEATTCKFYYEAGKVVVGNRCLYAYYQNPESITHTEGSALSVDSIWALEHRARFFEEQKEAQLAAQAWRMLVDYYIRDSREYEGRCDGFLRDFKTGKVLSNRIRLELCLYNHFRWAYWPYKKLWSIGSKIKAKLH